MILCGLLLAPAAAAHPGETAPTAVAAALDAPCGGDPMTPDKVITGSFESSLQGSYVMVPFTVPARTTAVRVKYCFDQPDSPTSQRVRHTLDLGLWGPGGEFRGWGGSSHPDVWVSREGFSPEAAYKAAPRGNVAGRTTRGFLPGPVTPGVWEAELGLAAIAGVELGDLDGAVGWRLELAFPTDPAYGDEPYVPAPYDARPARAEAGWYAGDLHVHAEHSSLGDATMTEVFDYAFGPAKLDFITLSDYVTRSGWGEIGRYQGRHPGRLVARSSEVITYRGHVNNHTSGRYVDHRTGPVFGLKPDGGLELRRGARPASEVMAAIRAAGGFTQVNHPTIFPSEVPGFALQCRGCPWDYSDEETDWRAVDAYEVHTGPAGVQDGPAPGLLGPNPFTPLAVDEYERLLAGGHHVAAVAVSDSHNAGRRNDPVTQAPIGQGQTVVHARELSEAGVRCGVQAGHTYAKVWGSDRPDLRLTGTAEGVAGEAIFGDTLRARGVRLAASAPGGTSDYQLVLLRDGVVVQSVGADQTISMEDAAPGRYGLRIMRGSSYEAISTPLWVEDPGTAPPALVTRDCSPAKLRSAVGPRLRVLLSGRGLIVNCRLTGGRARRCTVIARARGRTIARGSGAFRGGRAPVRLRPTRAGRAMLRRGRLRVRLSARAASGAALALDRRTVTLRPR